MLLWSLFGSARRIMANIVFFLPSLGLFGILHHWRAEQLPFAVRQEADRDNMMTPDDIIQLNGMTRNVSWTDIDRWTYANDSDVPPPYSLYTGLALGETFISYLVIMTLQLLVITVIKIKTVRNIKKEKYFNVLVHIVENINVPFPYKDWDTEDLTVAEFKEKLREVNIEMVWSYAITILVNMLMFVPFWWTGSCYLFILILKSLLIYNFSTQHHIKTPAPG